MELTRPKIELYRVRTFSQKISDTFDFIRESWRPLLKYFIYIMLPMSIVMAFFIDNFMGYYTELLGAAFLDEVDFSSIPSYLLMVLGTVVMSCVILIFLEALVFAMLRLYQERENRLNGLTFAELKPEMHFCAARATNLLFFGIAIVFLLGVLLVLIGVILASISPVVAVVGFILTYGAIAVFILPLSLIVPVYLMEDDISIIEALQKALRLGLATWGGIFAVSIVLSFLGMALQTLTFVPWYVMTLAKSFLTLNGEGSGFMGTAGYSFLQYLSCIWMLLGHYLVMALGYIGLTIQYGHASDKIDGTGVAQKIEKFDELDQF